MLAWKQLFIQRVRNSSLVERSRVDDERASRLPPKPRTRIDTRGRGALKPAVKEGRRALLERFEKKM